MTYYMTSPEGEKFGGYWDVDEVEEPRRFTFRDGFADADLNPNPDLPISHCDYAFSLDRRRHPGGRSRAATTRPRTCSKVLDMGMEEGARTAINQIDGFLAKHTQNA